MNPFPPLKGLFKVLLGLFLLVFAFGLLDVWLINFHTPGWEPEFVSTSPDGRFTVSVYDNPGVLLLPPGLHPRGSAGTVVLRENKTGKVLQRAKVSYVDAGSKAPDITWGKKGEWVLVTSLGDWDLPPEKPAR